MAGEAQDITTGEVYRKLEDMDRRYTLSFSELWEQTSKTNGRVSRHDVALGIHWWAIGLVGAAALTALGVVLAKVLL